MRSASVKFAALIVTAGRQPEILVIEKRFYSVNLAREFKIYHFLVRAQLGSSLDRTR
jgi:hypothetical protein